MAIGGSRKSSSRLRKIRRKREQKRRRGIGRHLRVESLEERRLLAIGPQVVGVQPSDGSLLDDSDIRNVTPRDLTFQFNESQVVDATTLGAVTITRAGLDGQFDVASARTDFNTGGAVVVQFQAKTPGPIGNEISVQFSKSDRGASGAPVITVEGKTVLVELNSNQNNETTALALVDTINNHLEASELLEAIVVAGPSATVIATPAITYSPLDIGGANVASVTSNFNTGPNLEITFAAVQGGPVSNGLAIEVTKTDRGGAADPLVDVSDDQRTISIDLNSNPGNETTASQLVTALDANAEARALVFATVQVGNLDTNIATPPIDYSPLVLQGANDVPVTPGYLGLGDSDREVIFRFAETSPDDLYRIDIIGVGSAPLRNDQGFALGDKTDDGVDDGQDFSLEFELDLGAQVLGVVPQPVIRTASGVSQSASQIEVYFNDDDLDPISATDPAFYQLIFTGKTATDPYARGTVENTDDDVYNPIAVQYFPESDRAMLTFRAPLHQLGSGSGTFRLRIGTDEVTPLPPNVVDLSGVEVPSSFATAHDLGALGASEVIMSAISPQVHQLEMPGSNDEPGHRNLSQRSTDGSVVESHLFGVADPVNGLTTLFYNFREDYGVDQGLSSLTNLITEQQKERAREIFEIYGGLLGVQFVETQTQGFTIATGDLRAAIPNSPTGAGDGVVLATVAGVLENDSLLVMDNGENWYDGFGSADDPNQISWFEETLRGVGSLLGLGDAYDLPSSTITSGDTTLDFGVAPEPTYPGDQDIVHGQHLYRPEGSDIDLYKFQLAEGGQFTATTVAERGMDASLLDSVIALYRDEGGRRELIARNDDYFSDDSYIELDLEPGVYYVGVSSTGNVDYDPAIEDSGFGGLTEGPYELRLTFRPDADSSILDLDHSLNDEANATSRATALDGDGDGVPGGEFNFWFRVDATPIIVDKMAPAGGNGDIRSPYKHIDDALAVARPGDVVRIVGNGGVDGDLSTPDDAQPYQIGFDLLGRPLADGATLEIPDGVTVMIDRGAVFKLRRARIGVGSSSPLIDRSAGALQVLGTPRLVDVAGNVLRDENNDILPGSVYFTSLNDESMGGDQNPSINTAPLPGDWGGLSFRADLDRAAGRFDYEREGIFLNYVNQADMRYGGGSVIVEGVPRVTAPVHATGTRPTVTFNTITHSADAAISANPDSFEETIFHSPQYQAVPFTPDYSRIGPDVHGNRVTDNSINGMFIRQRTPAGGELQKLTVSGRWDDSDIVHVVAENLKIQGSPGGPIQYVEGPAVNLVDLQTQGTGTIPDGLHYYRLTMVDADGSETPASDPTNGVLVSVTDPDTGDTESVQLSNLPLPTAPYVGRKLYRTTGKSVSQYVLVKEWKAGDQDGTDRTYVDDGTVAGGLLAGSTLDLNARLQGRLAIDPGTIVKLNGAGIETSFGSQLIAEGLDGNEVVFTSLLDNRYGAGGTFETSDQGSLAVGNWSGIYAGHMSRVSIDHAVLAYGGGVSEVAGSFAAFNPLEIHQSEVRITNSIIENSASGIGGQATPNRGGHSPNESAVIFVRGAQPIIVNNIIHDNAGPAVNIDVNSLNNKFVADYGRSTGRLEAADHIVDNQGPLVRENRLHHNFVNAIQVRGGTLTTGGVWDDTDIAHVVRGETIYVSELHTYGGLRLASNADESLVVKLDGGAGFTATGRSLEVADRIGGVLQIVGQPEYPVVMTSLNDCSVAAGFKPDGSPQFQTYPTACDVITPVEQIPLEIVEATTDANKLRDALLGPGITPVGNATLVSGPNSAGIFQSGLSTIRIEKGVVLASGDIYNSEGPNITGSFSSSASLLEDVDLDTEFGLPAGPFQGTEDTTYLQFDFQLAPGASQDLFFNFVFASEEYNEFANTMFNDVFAFFVDGNNVALLPATTTPVSINTVNGGNPFGVGAVNPQYYNNNDPFDGGQYLTVFGYDGFTTPLTAEALGIGPGVHTIKLAISDVSDTAWDAAVFLQFGSFSNLRVGQIIPPAPGDWRGIRMEENTHDRNVDVATERETGNVMVTGNNEDPATAQSLGFLAPDEKAGDDNRRLGFEVHGSLNRPGDVDVYSFDANVGTEVWLDIDRTTYSLDTVVELIDSNGNILALSDNSAEEAADPSLLIRDPLVMEAGEVNPLSKSAFDSRDQWSTNPRDAGMRVVLPGPQGTTNTYHVRVRSSSNDLADVDGGLTSGVYQLQIRLQEADEFPGATVQMADIRYGTNGIELIGLPAHSPLTGEAAEALDANGNDINDPIDLVVAPPTGFDDLGNLLNADRGTLSVAGRIEAFEVQTVTFATVPTIGNFVLSFAGQTTRNIPFDADAAAIQSALEALSTVGPGNVAVSGTVGGVFDVVFQGALANTDVPQMTAAAGVPAIDVVPTTATTTVGEAADVDWYRFEVRYDAIRQEGTVEPMHAAAVFDIDYADGFARANTNLWVFDDLGQLVLVGRDSNVAEDRPIGGSSATEDLSRGSIGALDPFIGAVELPASGFAPGEYYVAVASNAVVPDEMQQFLSPTPNNPFLRLEPINSVNRIAEDHFGSQGPTTAISPEVPILFGLDDQVTLLPPAGNRLSDGETFTVTNQLGNSVTYEFDSDGTVAAGHVAIEYGYRDSSFEVGTVIGEAITENSPTSPDLPDPADPDPPVPSADSPLVFSTLDVTLGPDGEVTLAEDVEQWTLLNTVTTTDPTTNQLIVTPLVRTTTHQAEPAIRQHPAPGGTEIGLNVSRPGIVPFDLGDVTLFVSQDGLTDRTEVVSVDGFTGQQETRIGAFGANVGDIALHPGGAVAGGGLYAYSIPDNPTLWTDADTGNYWQIDPGSSTPAALGANLGDDGIVTYVEDATKAGKAIVANGKAGVGVQFNAMTFNNAETQALNVQGFAVGNRGDTIVDPITGQVFSTAVGIPNPANILFEFNPTSGVAVGGAPPGGNLSGGGTQIAARGALDTSVDGFPIGGSNTTVTGVEATTIDATGATPVTQFVVEDEDVFEVDQDGDGTPDVTFVFDSGPEVFFAVDTLNPTDPNVLRDQDRFSVDGVQFEFDTGTVIVVFALNGSQLADGGTIQITDNATNPATVTFEFDNDSTTAGNTPIPFANTDNQQAIISNILNAINGVPSFGVNAVQLPGTNRITLLGESPLAGANVSAAGVVGDGAPGVSLASVQILVEETFTVDEIGPAIMGAVNQTPGFGYEAGTVGNRLNFMGALAANFAGVSHPIFGAVNLVTGFPTGVAGTTNPFDFPVPFLASDNAADIAVRVHTAVVSAGFNATQTGATVFLDEGVPQPAFVCNSQGTPPLIGAPGVADCPLRSGGAAPGGSITGMAFIGEQLYAVTDTGGLFRIADSLADPLDPDSIPGEAFNAATTTNVADYIDGSRELLQTVNEVTQTTIDALTGEETEVRSFEPIRFAGLVAGPQNSENGDYESLLFGIDNTGRLFAFDTFGRPQVVFANGASFADTGLAGANGMAFSTLDDNLWHVTLNRNIDLGHGVGQSFDGSRLDELSASNASLYFGYEDDVAQSQFGTGNFAPATPAYTYDFPGGSHGSLVSNTFSLGGYAGADKPTLYFNYFLDTEQADNTYDATLFDSSERMLDSFRVYISGDDGRWKLLSTNNSDRDALDETNLDEFDPFLVRDPETGEWVPEQPFDRSETFEDAVNWRQARLDMSPYAGQDNLRLRFDFSTAGGLSSGGRDVTMDLNIAGNELRAIPGAELRDGQMFTLTDLRTNPDTELDERVVVAAFEFDMGPTIVAPTGAAIVEGARFDIDGRVYEFDNDGAVGATDNIPHVPVTYDGSETAGEMAINIEQVLLLDPPPPTEVSGDLAAVEPNDTLATAFVSGLDGSTQVFRASGTIGDNLTLTDNRLDVDMIALHLDKGDSVTIETDTSRLATQLDSYLRLFDANGAELAANDDVDPDSPFSRDSRIDFTALSRGTYYVGISSAHNTNYKPSVPESGSSGGVETHGFYEFSIAVTDPTGPQRVGNRLNLPNADVITATGPAGSFVDSFVDGQAGVTQSLPNPFGTSLPPIPVYPIRADAGMTALRVADAVQTSLADNLAGGNIDTIKTQHEVVQVVQNGIGDAGPLGLSGASDPNTAVANSGLFGDLFGAFDLSALVDGVTAVGYPGALGMQNNQFEGVYVDDIIVGFSSRGEMVVGSDTQLTQTTQFVVNSGQPADEIDTGAYQLEIRQATEHGLSDESPDPTLQLYRGFDVDDRLVEGVTLVVEGGHIFADGQTFSVGDGQQTVTFEFDDMTAAGGNGNGVAAGNMAILFDPSDTDVLMARRIRDAINSSGVPQPLDITAVSTDGVVTGTTSTSNRIDLFGDVALSVGLVGNGPTGNLPVEESNDTLATAEVTGIMGGGREGFHATGFIGDNSDLAEFGADVDLFRVELKAGELIAIDIDASESSSPLDTVVRVFDSTGAPVMVLDDQGNPQPVESDDDIAPGENASVENVISINRDSFITFTAPDDGVYYIGVSAYGNGEYDPTLDPNADVDRRPGTPGHYEIDILRPSDSNGLSVVEHEGRGDSNLERDQGQVIIHSNRITHSSEFGIRVNPGTRGVGTTPRPGPARNLSQINNSQLAPGVTITNNILAGNRQGGIDFSGDAGVAGVQPAVVPFGRIINNTIVGLTAEDGTSVGDVGIRVANNASPTLLNNILSFVETGIDVDATSTTTVIGGSLYHNNTFPTNGIGVGDFSITADATVRLFVDRENGNYYPAEDSLGIDSSVDSLEDRSEMTQMGLPLGIAASPMLAPIYDASGQLRVDDPDVAPPPGVGESVFKDRGAQDRADFEGPAARMVGPLDNGANDLDPSFTLVNLFRASLNQFSIQLVDSEGPRGGIGVDDSTVNSSSVTVVQDDRVLVEGDDFSFDYNTTSNVIRLTPLAGVWDQDSNYVVRFSQEDRFVVFGVSGDKLIDGYSFDAVDEFGNATTFEYDTGYVIDVPQTLALQIPSEGGGTGGVSEGDTITVEDTVSEAIVTFELDSDGAVNVGNTAVAFSTTSTQGEIADAVATELANAGLNLNPAHPGSGLVHLGTDGSHTVTVTSSTITILGADVGVADGETFTVDDGTKVVTFEFTESSFGATNVVPVSFSLSMTHEQIADAIVTAINGTDVGLSALNMGDGRVQLGGSINHIVDVSPANLTLTGQPGARLPWGLRIPTTAGVFADLVTDGETFVIDNGVGTNVTFELDSDGLWTPGNTAIPFSDTNTTWQLANTMVSRIRNTNLGLYPLNFGNGIVALGGDGNFILDVTNTALTEVGVAGLPGAVAIPFTPDADFTAEDTAEVTAQIINTTGLPGITAELAGELVYVSGVSDMIGATVAFSSSIKDLAGNPLRANQVNGETRFTVFIGAGMDYGDAPDPYPTRRADDGARHVIVDGFSLGPVVQVNADGQPTLAADGDDDEDGVVFDPATPLVPNRSFNVTVSTSGIGTVEQFGVLDGWIDFNRDGDWNDFGEHIIANEILTTAVLTNGQITFADLDVPSNAAVGDTYARFRLSTAGSLGPAGETNAGEVEDYLVTISANPWQNLVNRFDVNNSGDVSPIDVLILINTMKQLAPPPAPPDVELPVQKPVSMHFLDPTGDGHLSNLDILAVIVEINRLNQQQGEGEFGGFTTVVSAADATDSLLNAGDVFDDPVIASSTGRDDVTSAFVQSRNPNSAADSSTERRATDLRRSSSDVPASSEPRRLSPRASSGANHLADILNHDESWLDIVEDVDLAMQGVSDRDAFFSDIGV